MIGVEWLTVDAAPAGLADAVRAADREEAAQSLALDLPETGRTEILIEPLIPNSVLLIVGGGHIGQALAAQANIVGFDIALIEDRPEFANCALFPDATDIRCGDIVAQLAEFPISSDTFVTIVTRGHRHDEQALAACINRPARYIGMIGSRRKGAMIRQSLLDAGVATQEQLDRVYAPIGLDIGATTVPEIAASIVAQLIAVRRKGSSARFSQDLR